MKKQIKKFGSSLVVRFNKDEIQWNNLQAGDWVEMTITLIKKGDQNVKGKKA